MLGRDRIKAGIRRVGVATARHRVTPDFLLIGTKRGGTTSFYFDLIAHPSYVRLFPPPVPLLKPDATKGVHYFDSNYGRGFDWYRSYFPTHSTMRRARARHGTAVTGEASPYYLFHPDAARRAHQDVPEAKVIALLRDPVQRTYSHWKERRRGGAEPLGFREALDAEPGRLAGERERLLANPTATSYAWEQQSYATQSRYAESLTSWVDLFGQDRVLVLASEDYYRDPTSVLGDVDDFLGVPRRTTTTGEVRNAAPGSDLDPALAEMLRAQFADDGAALSTMTGRDFPWTS